MNKLTRYEALHYLANMTPPKYAGFNILHSIDRISQIVIQNLFVGKFYALFSMLFGLSFYLLLDQKKWKVKQ